MLITAFACLSLAVLLGLFLAGTQPSDRGAFRRWPWLHGVAGTAGFLLLVWAWRRGALGGPFAADALGLIGLGLLAGLVIAVLSWRRGGVSMAVILTHAVLGGIGYLIVAGFAFG